MLCSKYRFNKFILFTKAINGCSSRSISNSIPLYFSNINNNINYSNNNNNHHHNHNHNNNHNFNNINKPNDNSIKKNYNSISSRGIEQTQILPGIKLSDIDLTSSNVMNVSEDFLYKLRYQLPIATPKIVLNSKYKKYAIQIRDNESFDDILATAAEIDKIQISTDFYNTLFYIYILKLEELQNIDIQLQQQLQKLQQEQQESNNTSTTTTTTTTTTLNDNSNNDNDNDNDNDNNNYNNNLIELNNNINNNKQLIESIIITLKRIYLSNYKPNQLSILLNILSFVKRRDEQVESDLIEFCEDICLKVEFINHLFTLESFQIILQYLYNIQQFKTVCKVYQAFKDYFPLLGENEVWHSGIIIQSMELSKVSIKEIEEVFKESKLQLTQYTQVHFNTLALSYIRCNPSQTAEFFSVLQSLFLADLPVNEKLPAKGLQTLLEDNDYDLAIKVYPLLFKLLKRDEKRKSKLRELILSNEYGQIYLDSINDKNQKAPDYVFSKDHISKLEIIDSLDNLSFLGIHVPVPKRKNKKGQLFSSFAGYLANSSDTKDLINELTNVKEINNRNHSNNISIDNNSNIDNNSSNNSNNNNNDGKN